MGYRIVKRAQAWWPVEWDGVTDDGTIVTNRIELRFYLLKVDAGMAFIRDVNDAQDREAEEGVDHSALYAGLVQRIASDWRGVEAENGEPLRWDGRGLEAIAAAGRDGATVADIDAGRPGPNLCLLLNEPGLFTAIIHAFRACLGARKDIRAGN
ncbi:hypothetical protein ASE73_02555 [Sphingomonas sp. Leaf24]|uniref:hypothetical protein n=1 Tax=unclassified Sphingomonas TaxID=196159 RepID=UPI0006F9FE99|nr:MULTISPECIES: hypothetical protein [unclassified Sphingomonas]KQM23124.1 hypothetical protein ASE50_02555 [Sphingomonas sp. Leaf5]KQM95982.1 hypothetical protein ASE73_02555 [Sphingomonas sp. Leaf24]